MHPPDCMLAGENVSPRAFTAAMADGVPRPIGQGELGPARGSTCGDRLRGQGGLPICGDAGSPSRGYERQAFVTKSASRCAVMITASQAVPRVQPTITSVSQ